MNGTQITPLQHRCRCTVPCVLLPTNPSLLNRRGSSQEWEHSSEDKYMCNPASHNTGCHEQLASLADLGPHQMCNLGKYRGDWENKDKAVLQKGTVGPRFSQRHGAQSLSLFSTPETQDGERVTKSASILMGEVLTQELHWYSRAFLFHSGFPRTGSFHSFYEEMESGPLQFQPRLKIVPSPSKDHSPDFNGYFCYVCVGTNMGDQ